MRRHGGHPSLKNDIDLEGCSPLQPRNPIKTKHWTRALVAPNKACIDQHGAEGPDALQAWEKSKLGRHGGHPSLKNDIDLEGCSPLQPWNQ